MNYLCIISQLKSYQQYELFLLIPSNTAYLNATQVIVNQVSIDIKAFELR